jgi:hypothetical protein
MGCLSRQWKNEQKDTIVAHALELREVCPELAKSRLGATRGMSANLIECTLQPRDLHHLSFQYAPEPTASFLLPLLSIGSSSRALRRRMDNAEGGHEFTTEVSKWSLQEPMRGVYWFLTAYH